MMMKPIIISLSLAMALFSCGGKKKPAEDKQSLDDLKTHILEVHDEVMPRMGEMTMLRKNLKRKLDSLHALGDSTSALSAKLRHGIVELDTADASMWNWMHAFEGGYKGKTEEDTYAYYLGEEVAIDSVKTKMLRAIKIGQELSK